MASVFGHAIAAIGIGKLFPKKVITPKVYVLGAVSSMLPDLDVMAYKFGLYGDSMWNHRGITHSFFAALLWAIILLMVYHRSQRRRTKIRLGFYYFIATASHGILDAMTTGGDGISFFAPFNTERYFLPWRYIQVSPLGIKNFFSEWGVEVLQSEFVYILLPSLVLGLVGNFLNKKVYQ